MINIESRDDMRKGFTIPELLATIVIIGVLTLVATASYNSISLTVKKSTLESKLKLIKEKAIEYAQEYSSFIWSR